MFKLMYILVYRSNSENLILKQITEFCKADIPTKWKRLEVTLGIKNTMDRG